MPSYLGPLGALAPIRGLVHPLRVATERPQTARTTIGGVRKAQIGPRTHRTWDVRFSQAAAPNEIAQFAAFLAGEFGPGPFWWIDAWAQVTNVLDPRTAALEAPWPNTVHGGPYWLSDGAVAGRSLVTDGTQRVHLTGPHGTRVPCVAGVPVTASTWLSSAEQTLWLEVRGDEAGTVIARATTVAGQDTPVRVSATVVPPRGAHSVTVSVSGAGRIIRPAVTWTPGLVPYHAGQGAPRVVIGGDLTQDVILAHAGRHGQLAGAAFTVTEVG